MMPYFVRTATSRDIAALRALLVETWHATYDELYGAARVTERAEYSASLPYPIVSLGLALIWLAALAVVDSRDEDEIGAGTTE